MDRHGLVVVIHDTRANDRLIEEALKTGEHRTQSVQQVPVALARIAGGGVDVAILDLSSLEVPEPERLDCLLKLRAGAPHLPLVAVVPSDTASPIMTAIRAGKCEYVVKDRCGADLAGAISAALDRSADEREPRPPAAAPVLRKEGSVLTLLGANGGTGTTTVALNLACVLAQSSTVILAEVRPTFGTLWQYFRPHHGIKGTARLLDRDPLTISPPEVERCLWSSRELMNLQVLFGPRSGEECHEIRDESVRALKIALCTLARQVVLDLPPTLSAANRAALEVSDFIALVVERDAFSVEAGRRMLETIRSWEAIPPLSGAVVVNRAALATPIEISDIETNLAIPVLGVIPPAADLCAAAHRSGLPLTLFDPDCLAAQSMTALAERLVRRL